MASTLNKKLANTKGRRSESYRNTQRLPSDVAVSKVLEEDATFTVAYLQRSVDHELHGRELVAHKQKAVHMHFFRRKETSLKTEEFFEGEW